MEIKKFNYNLSIEYDKFVRKYNKSKYLYSLEHQTFQNEKKIFLLVNRGFWGRYKIIGYAIIYEELRVLCISNNISQKYDRDKDTIFISDFMIDKTYQNNGLGKKLANYIVNELYNDKNIILQPDGDGNWFWKKFGFVPDNISKNLTLILDRNRK